jgi:hypothetical protein
MAASAGSRVASNCEVLEVGEEDVAGGVVLLAGGDEVLDVGEGLGLGGVEGVACGLVLDEEFAGPEEVDEAGGAGEALCGDLKGRDVAACAAAATRVLG